MGTAVTTVKPTLTEPVFTMPGTLSKAVNERSMPLLIRPPMAGVILGNGLALSVEVHKAYVDAA